jgi:hypothetical protein
MHPICRQAGEQNSDQRDKADDEAQPNHSLTRKSGVGKEEEQTCDIHQPGNKRMQYERRPSGIM